MKIRLGTRGSELALTQSRWVADRIREAAVAAGEPVEVEEVVLRTQGDADQLSPLHQHSTPGVFTKELERALTADEIDLAVHSLKDLPTATPAGLVIAAVPVREEPWDAWVSEKFPDLIDLPDGARVATGSLRRRAQILHAYPHLVVEGIRGNIDTRIAKSAERGDAGLILAAAGLRRTGRTGHIRGTFSVSEMTPAPGQGALALETRADDAATRTAVARVDDPRSHAEVIAERTFLAALEGGCHLPIGAFARASSRALTLVGMVASPDGVRLVRMGTEGTIDDPTALGETLAVAVRRAGGEEILAAIAADPAFARDVAAPDGPAAANDPADSDDPADPDGETDR